MGILDFFKVKKAKSDLSNNPYATKYCENDIGLDNVVYLLYCDYEESSRWIKDAKKPSIYFSNFDKAVQILEVLNSYRFKYKFYSPTPATQLQTLQTEYENYTKNFIIGYWNQTIKAANSLKTTNGKENRIQSFFEDISNYSERLTPTLLNFINSLKDKPELIDNEKDKNPQISCGKYTLCTLQDILNIPNSDIEHMRLLQKAATDFKRNNRMDLAIECLRKSNIISDCSMDSHCKLSADEYLRIIKYMNNVNQAIESTQEENSIRQKHPEFWDKRISNLKRIKEDLAKNKEWKNDLVVIQTSTTCQICSKYNNKVYSISGKTKKYPMLPKTITEEGGFCPNCYLGINSFFEGINSSKKRK